MLRRDFNQRVKLLYNSRVVSGGTTSPPIHTVMTKGRKMNKGKITISRPCSAREDEVVSIQIYDKDARIKFIEVEIGLANMMQAITGLGNVSCEFETRGLDCVGKVRESEPFIFEYKHEGNYNDKAKNAHISAIAQAPDGWTPSSYFGSKDSFFSKDGKDYARTTINRWVDKNK